ncbi:hypothetical protein FOCC_FOCC015591 [Frankliniella occidentalis]|nr:hypothetical protein FOCC_FOCC015591 [Frankliniella occidentalis]
MEMAIQECCTVEKSMQYSKELNGTANTIAVDSLKVSRKYDSKKKKDSKDFKCSKCGYSNDYGKCPAYGKACIKCKELNHFASRCPKNKDRVLVHASTVEEKVDSVEYEVYCTDSLEVSEEIYERDLMMTTEKERPTEYLQAIKGLGKFPDKHPIIIKKDSGQIIRPALRKPASVSEKLKPCLDSLVERGVIEKVEHLSSDCWVSNLVTVSKPSGEIRLCIDPTDLNKVIIREPYTIPSIPELAEKINHKKYYSLFDLKDGFYHIELDEESQNKCCFATPFGIYKFLRCPFGLASAPELFQKLNEQVFGDIPNVIVYFDDVLACGKTEEEHDEAVKRILERARENNVRFNPNKLQYKQLHVKYIGHVFCQAGMQLDPDRIKGLMELEIPTNRDQLASILGVQMLRNLA